MYLINLVKMFLSLLWIDTNKGNCFGVSIDEDQVYSPEVMHSKFKQSVLVDWLQHIVMDNYGKVVHTFESGNRWFMVGIKHDIETNRYVVKTTNTGGPLTEQEERLLEFFEWYLGRLITVTRDVDRESGNKVPVGVYTRRNENWCTGKNSIFVNEF